MQTKLKLSVVLILLSTILFSSCAALGGGQTNSSGYASGASFGSSLLSLYSQYKKSGRIDLTNPNTLLSLTTLASNTSNIKANLTNKEFYSDFASGAIVGSKNTVTNSTVDNVISTATRLDFSSVLGSFMGGRSSPATGTTSNLIGALTGLLSTLGR